MSDDNSIRAELRSIRQQEFGAWLPERELRALSRRAQLLIKTAGLWGVAPDAYERWLEGASLEQRGFVNPADVRLRVARAKPAAAPSQPLPPSSPGPAATRAAPLSSQIGKAPMTETIAHAAPRPSRAAEAADVHLAGINASRKQCGLAPLTAAEVAHAFGDLDRTPARSSGMTRRARGNAIAARQRAPTTQATIDEMWSGFAAKLNVMRSPAPAPADASPAASVRQSQASISDMWADIARRGNAEAGLKTPAKRHA